jgi:hypothetical protein
MTGPDGDGLEHSPSGQQQSMDEATADPSTLAVCATPPLVVAQAPHPLNEVLMKNWRQTADVTNPSSRPAPVNPGQPNPLSGVTQGPESSGFGSDGRQGTVGGRQGVATALECTFALSQKLTPPVAGQGNALPGGTTTGQGAQVLPMSHAFLKSLHSWHGTRSNAQGEALLCELWQLAVGQGAIPALAAQDADVEAIPLPAVVGGPPAPSGCPPLGLGTPIQVQSPYQVC